MEPVRHTLRKTDRGDRVGGDVLRVEYDEVAGVGGGVVDIGDQPARPAGAVVRRGENRLARCASRAEVMTDGHTGLEVVAEQGAGYMAGAGQLADGGMAEAGRIVR